MTLRLVSYEVINSNPGTLLNRIRAIVEVGIDRYTVEAAVFDEVLETPGLLEHALTLAYESEQRRQQERRRGYGQALEDTAPMLWFTTHDN